MKVIFAGTPEFAAGNLRALIDSNHDVVAVITQPDKPGKRGKQPVPGPVKKTAAQHGLPVLQPEKLKVDDLISFDFDLLVVVAFGQILSDDLLAYPRFGCINVHTSLLPRWRGAAPIQRAILEGDEKTGVTIMEIDKGLDTGDMLAWQDFAIENHDTSATVFEKMLTTGGPLLVSVLDRIERGAIEPVKQSDSGACYAKKVQKEEAEISWQESNSAIDRKVRAFQPSPVAYTFLDDLRVKIHQGTPVTGDGEPGAILDVSKGGVRVACGEGAYLIERIQLPVGKGKILTPSDVLNGRTDLINTAASFNS